VQLQAASIVTGLPSYASRAGISIYISWNWVGNFTKKKRNS